MNAESTNPPTPQPRPHPRLSLWLGVLIGPIAWVAQLIVGYGFVPYACDHGSKVALYILALAAAVLTIGAGYFAWMQWQAVNQRRWTDLSDPGDARSFLGVFGVLMSLLFFALIALTGLAAIATSPCPLITMKLP